jgi:ABC-type uncharacterized transport system substrate-binding protein
MGRREFIALLGGTVVSRPVIAAAQQSNKVYRIAILHPSHPVSVLTATSSFNYWRAFFEELNSLGYTEGRNLVVERYSAEGRVEKYAEIVRNAVNRDPDLLFAVSDQIAPPSKEATSTIPIVALTSDPLYGGLVSSLARPGGNLTGVSIDGGLEIWGRRFQLFRELVPALSKVGVLTQRQNAPERDALLRTVAKAAIPLVGPSFIENSSEADYRRFFSTISQEGAEALLVDGSPDHVTKRKPVVELAATFRLPTIYPYRSFVEAGGLMSYGTDVVEVFRLAARSIDKILKGTRPGDIPYYQPRSIQSSSASPEAPPPARQGSCEHRPAGAHPLRWQ